MNTSLFGILGLSHATREWIVAAMSGVAILILVFLGAQLMAASWSRYRSRFIHGIERQLRGAHLYVDASRLLALNIALVLFGILLVWWLTDSLLICTVLAMVLGLIPRCALWWMRRRRLQALRHQLPDAAMLMAGGLRAGMSLNQALAQTAAELPLPLRQEIELMLREQRMGAGFESALSGLERRIPLEENLLLCAALRISRQTGGSLAVTLESLADALRRKIALEGKIRALTAQGRLQAWAMGSLPLLCALALALIEPHSMSLLIATPIGWSICVGLLAMQAIGLYLLRRIVRIDV